MRDSNPTPSSWTAGTLARLLVVLLVLPIVTPRVVAQGPAMEEASMETWASGRLAARFASLSSSFTLKPDLTVDQLRTAYELAVAASEADPDSLPAWRWLFDLSSNVIGDFPEAEAARTKAIEAIVRLDPDDATMRLALLMNIVESRDTLKARIEGCESLLASGNIERLGRPAAARVALDLATYEAMAGRANDSLRHLTQAVTLDPTFPEAIDRLVGLAEGNLADPVDEAGLLATAFTANPTDGVTARSLASLALQRGAYDAAASVFPSAIRLSTQKSFLRDLTLDYAIAMWGAGRSAEALKLLTSLQTAERNRWEQAVKGSQDDVDQVKRDAAFAGPAPDVMLLATVIKLQSDPDASRSALISALFTSFDFAIQRNEIDRRLWQERFEEASLASGSGLDPDANARAERESRNANLRFDMIGSGLQADEAWARAWFGWKPEPSADELETPRPTLEQLIDSATTPVGEGDEGGWQALTESQAVVVRGWMAISDEKYETARALLEPDQAVSVYAAAGIAMLNEIEGRTREAAAGYRDVYYGRPGELVGLWCRGRLGRILGLESVPEAPTAAPLAARIKETLPSAVAAAIRDDANGAIAIEISPRSPRFQPFEAVLVDVKITNMTGLDLAIEEGGPIDPRLAILPIRVTVPGLESLSGGRQLIRSLHRRLNIPAQQSFTCTYDLSATWMAELFDRAAVEGGGLALRAASNYRPRSEVSVDTRIFGREANSVDFFIRKQRPMPSFGSSQIDPKQVVAAYQSIESIEDLKSVAVGFDQILRIYISERSNIRPELFATFLDPLVEGFAKLPPAAQAWFLGVLTNSEAEARSTIAVLEPLIEAAVDSRDPRVLLMLLARFSNSPSARAITVSAGLENPSLARAAESVRNSIITTEARNERELELGGGF